MTASAICATSRPDRIRIERRPVVLRAPSPSASVSRVPLAWRIGKTPHRSAVSATTRNVNATTVGLMAISPSLGTSSGASAVIADARPTADTRPMSPPASVSTPISRSQSRASWPRDAPSARRRLCSRRRSDTRVSSRPETFAHAINRSTATAAQSVHSAGWTAPNTCSRKDSTTDAVAPLQPARLLRVESRFGRVDFARGGPRIEARPQTADDVEHADGVERREVRLRTAARENRHGRLPELRAVRKVEPARHDADDAHGRAVEPQRLADDRRIAAESADPRAVVQHDHRLRVRHVVRGLEAAAEQRPHAEGLEEIRGGAGERQPGGLAASLEHGVPDVGADERAVRERLAGRAPLAEVAIGHLDHGLTGDLVGLPGDDGAAGFGERQRAQQHGVDGAEDRAVRANRERQRHDDRRGVRQARDPDGGTRA